MAAILLSTGLVYEVAATRDQVNNALGAGAKADTTVGGVATSFRTSAVVAVADTAEALRPIYLTPITRERPA